MKRLLIPLLLVLGALTAARGLGTLQLPPPELEGSFVGTWYYTDPGFQIALFVDADAKGVLRFTYQVKTRQGAAFRTDDSGSAKYLDGSDLIKVRFVAARADENLIKGRHERTVQQGSTTIAESGDFEIYRAESGRKLVLTYPQWVVERTDSDGRVSRTSRSDVSRLFRKASEIVVTFEEIPF